MPRSYLIGLLLMYLSLLTLTHQQSLSTNVEEDSEQTITNRVQPLVNELAAKSMDIAWIKIKEEFDSYIQNLTTRRNELSEKASALLQSFGNHFTGQAPKYGCPLDHPDYVLFGTFCYLFVSNSASWYSAKFSCTSMDAYLARPDTAEKETFLEEQCKMLGDDHWAGGNDIATEGSWKWTDNDDFVTFSNWSPNQPNDWGSNQDCLAIGFESEGSHAWNDNTCSYSKPYICQREAITFH